MPHQANRADIFSGFDDMHESTRDPGLKVWLTVPATPKRPSLECRGHFVLLLFSI